MKTRFLTSGFLIAFCAGQAMAAPPVCPGGSNLTAAQITTLLVTANRYACGTQYDGSYFNETLTGGNLQEYRRGPSSTVDPPTNVGTYSINSTANTITYTYEGGLIVTYVIKKKGSTVEGNPGTYTFCQTVGNNVGQTIDPVTVQAGPCAVQP